MMRPGWKGLVGFGALCKVFALSVVLTLTLASAAFAAFGDNEASSPTISSDKADYAPGEAVTLTGANWRPGEPVHLSVTSEGGDQPWSRDVDVVADENGEISDQFQLPGYVVPKYYVTATGPTSGTATTSFTDGNVRASADLPSSDSWTLTKTFYGSSTSCATTPSPSSTQLTLSGTNTDTTAATATQSVKLEASSASGGGQRFFSKWTGPSGFTSTSGTICVQGFGGSSTRDYVANYVPALSINDVTVTEGNAGTTNATFTVSLSASSSQQVTVNFATADDTAIQPGDYTSSSGTLTFASGETTKSITVSVNGDTADEADERFFVNLSGATNATISDGQGVGTITDDDPDVNDAPVNSVPGPQTTDEDTALVFSGASKISISDPDAGSDPVEVELEVDEGTLTLSGTSGLSFTVGGNGAAKMTFTGTINDINAALDGMRYDPAANYEGTAQLSIVTNDQGHNGSGGARSDTDSVDITVSAVNDAPTAASQSVTTDEDTARTITLTGSDADGDTLTFEIATGPANGSLGAIGPRTCTGTTPKSCQANVTYTPAANYNGPDSFEFHVNDGTVNSADATVSVTVNPVNDAPTVAFTGGPTRVDESGTEGRAYAFMVSDPDSGDTFMGKSGFPDCGTGGVLVEGSLATTSSGGSFGCRFPDGPASPTVRIQVADSQAVDSNVATKDVEVDNVAPSINLSGPGTAEEGDTRTYAFTVTDPGDDTHTIVTACGDNGNEVAGSDTYDPDTGEGTFQCRFPDGPATSNVTARVTDSDGASDSDNRVVVVTVANIAPVARDDAYDTNEGEPLEVSAPGVLGNDEDAAGGDDALEARLVGDPSSGTLALNGNGSFTYEPGASFNGTDSFTYRANDGLEDGNNATVAVRVIPVNDPPVAGDDARTVDEDGLLVFPASDLTSNDSAGPPNESDQMLTVDSVGDPVNGTVSLSGGTITFAPTPDYSGPASFEYTVCDDGTTAGGPDPLCNDGVVNVTVSPINDDPTITAVEDQTIDEDGSTGELAFAIDDPDVPPGNLTVTASSDRQALVPDGNIVLGGTGADRTIRATPAPNANSDDGGGARITLEVRGGGGVATSSFLLHVRPVNDKPGFVKGDDPSVLEDSGDQQFPGWATGISAGPANESDQTVWFEVSSVNAASGGDAMFTEWPELSPGGTLTFTPAPNASGEATFDMRLMDDGGGEDASDEQRFKITIGPIDDHPTKIKFVRGPGKVGEGQTKTYRYQVEDIDDPSPIVESCGAKAEKIDTLAESSFNCFFPDGPGRSTVSIRAGPGSPRDKIKVEIANVAPEVILNGPSEAEEGRKETYEFTIDDPGDDAFGFVAGYPKCGLGSWPAGNPSIDGGSFQCEFRSGPTMQIVALKVKDSDGAFSNEAIKEVMVKRKAKDLPRTAELEGAQAKDRLRDEADSDVPDAQYGTSDDSPDSDPGTDVCGADPGDRTVICP